MRAARQGCRALQNVGTVRRAAQVCRPYERAGQFPVVTLIRPLRGHLPPSRGKAYRRPQGPPLRMPSQFGGGGTPQGGISRPSASHLPLKGEALREGQIPIPSVSLRSTSPLDKGSRPLPYGITEPVAVGARCARPQAAFGRPYGGNRTRSVCSAGSGAEVEPHQLSFSTHPGPSGPAGI